MRRLAALVVLAASLPAGASTVHAVDIVNFAFNPAAISAAPGDRVTWTWRSGTHSATAVGGEFDSGVKSSGTFSFDYTGGAIEYFCRVHPSMRGTIAPIDTVPPPAPAITAPADGAHLTSSSVRIAGTAGGDAVAVRLRETGSFDVEVPVTGGAWSHTRNFTSATHTVTATARDAAGNVSPGSASVTFTVEDLTPPPAPVITQPAPNQSFLGSAIQVAGTASDDTVSVEVFEAAARKGSAPAASRAWSLSLAFADGYHTISAVAIDADGNRSEPSASVRFLIDTQSPAVTMTQPSDLSVFGGTATFAGTATDNVEVASVTVELVNRVTGTRTLLPAACACPSPSVSWTLTTSPPRGIYLVTAIATDGAARATRSGSVTILVL